MPRELCPHCDKKVELSYGRKVSCPNCGGKLDVFDDEHPLGEKPIDSGYHFGSLSDSGYTPRDNKLHEGVPGSFTPSAVGGGVTYKQIGGLDEVITELDLVVNGSRKYPELWKHLGHKQTRGILLIGPPGCGKTLMAQAIANEANRKVCLVQGAEIKGWR